MVAKDSKLGFVVAGLLLGILMASMDKWNVSYNSNLTIT